MDIFVGFCVVMLGVIMGAFIIAVRNEFKKK